MLLWMTLNELHSRFANYILEGIFGENRQDASSRICWTKLRKKKRDKMTFFRVRSVGRDGGWGWGGWNCFPGDREILILSRNVSGSLRIAGILVREMASLPFQMMWTPFSPELREPLQLRQVQHLHRKEVSFNGDGHPLVCLNLA